MPRHPHPPLRDLLQQAQTEAEIWLPALLKSGRSSWIWRGVQHIEDVQLWLYVLMGLSAVMAFWQAWWLSVALAVVTVLVVRRWYLKDPAQDHGLPLEWNGWRIDISQRSLSRIGAPQVEATQQIDTLCLEPVDAWSLGILMGAPQERQAIYAWCIELRHRSRGPVATLCVLHSASAAHVVLQDIDALVDTLAQRLGIRRSGSRLLPPKRRQ